MPTKDKITSTFPSVIASAALPETFAPTSSNLALPENIPDHFPGVITPVLLSLVTLLGK